MQIKRSVYHVYRLLQAHISFFCFLHELLMSFTTQFPNSRFDIRITYTITYVKENTKEYISTTRHHSPDYITGKALKH